MISAGRDHGSPNVKFFETRTNMANSRRALGLLAHLGAGITLNVKEKSIADAILEPLYDSVILSNDYYSWEKECGVQIQHLRDRVPFFMQWHVVSERDTKQIAKANAIELKINYLTLKTIYHNKTDGS